MSELSSSQVPRNREDIYSRASKILDRRHSKYGKQPPVVLPNNLFELSKNFVPSEPFTHLLLSDSTISESDFSNPQIIPRFTPSARSSSLSSSLIEEEKERLSSLSRCLNDPTVDISTLLNKYLERSVCNASVKSTDPIGGDTQDASAFGEHFVHGEEALAKLQADESSWYRANEKLPASDTNFTTAEDNFDGAQSIGEFFWKKTEPIANLSLRPSPEKRYAPVPLVDPEESMRNLSQLMEEGKTFTRNLERDSAITLSMIKRALPHLQLEDSPRSVMQKLSHGTFKKPAPPGSKAKRLETAASRRSSTIASNSTARRQTVEDPNGFRTFLEEKVPDENKENCCEKSIGATGANVTKAKEVLVDSSNVLESAKLGKSPNATEACSLSSDACSELEFSETSPCPTPVSNFSSRSCSAASGSVQSLAGGKLPIESTKTELVWECVKIGKTSTQEFVLRNRANLRLRLSIIVTGTAFKVHKSGQEFVNSLTLALHPLESRTLTVAFTPGAAGAFCEKLLFVFSSSANAERECVAESGKRQTIHCYGYGGGANVDVGAVTKDSGGRMWMLLGRIGQRAPLRCEFAVRNAGNLPAFVAVQLSAKMQYHLNELNSALTVEPARCVLQPKEGRAVRVTLSVRNDDYRAFYDQCGGHRSVVDVGYFLITTGAEATRARLRRLLRKHRGEYDGVLGFLDAPYPGEEAPRDVAPLRETPASMKRLLKGLARQEISVTVETDPELTLVAPADDSFMFKSLCGETTAFGAHDDTFRGETTPPNEATPPAKTSTPETRAGFA